MKGNVSLYGQDARGGLFRTRDGDADRHERVWRCIRHSVDRIDEDTRQVRQHCAAGSHPRLRAGAESRASAQLPLERQRPAFVTTIGKTIRRWYCLRRNSAIAPTRSSQLGYDPHNAPWSAYGFVQDTIEKSDTREDNNRYGMGGSYLVSERLKVNGEVSDGDIGGIGGKLGTSYLQSERTNIYLNYVLEDERIESALASTRGSEGSLVSGVKTRVSDSSSVYAEERYRHGNSLTGLTHAAGVNLAPTPELHHFGDHRHRHAQEPADRRADRSRRRRLPGRIRFRHRCSCRAESSIETTSRSRSMRRKRR